MKRAVIYNVFFNCVKEIIAETNGFLTQSTIERDAVINRL